MYRIPKHALYPLCRSSERFDSLNKNNMENTEILQNITRTSGKKFMENTDILPNTT